MLFPKLRARTPLSRELLDKLDHDHALGELRIRELEHRLLGFEMMGEVRRAAFERAMQAYADFYFEHMAQEERELRRWPNACSPPMTGPTSMPRSPPTATC